MTLLRRGAFRYLDIKKISMSQNCPLVFTVGIEKHSNSFHVKRMRLMLFSYMYNLVGYIYLPIAMSLFLRLEIIMFQRINPLRVVVRHRDVLHQAQ